jgi:hypothetical protein
MKLKKISSPDFDDFKTNGQTATNSNREEIMDWELEDIIQYVDEHTTTDKGFCKLLVMSLFTHFGWKYFPKK